MDRSDEPASADEMLAEMQEEGNGPLGRYGQPVGEAYDKMRQRVVRQASGVSDGGTQRGGVARLRYTHEDCVDRIIMSPGIAEGELAQLYGVTTTWMSIVINCDAFKAKLAERRAELIDPTLLASLNERYGAMARKSVDVLIQKLNRPIEQISDKLALEAASLGAKAMGMGEGQGGNSPTPTDHLASIAHRLIDLNRPQPTFDVPSRVLKGEKE